MLEAISSITPAKPRPVSAGEARKACAQAMYISATSNHIIRERASAAKNSPSVETMRSPWLNSRIRSAVVWASFAESGCSHRPANAAIRSPARRSAIANTTRNTVAARESTPARAKAP